MVKCEAKIVGTSPISFGAPIRSLKNTGENHDAFEERVWRERIHRDANGEAFIPPTAIKNCLSDVARYLSESIPGKGKATYTRHFDAGVLVTDPLMLGVKADDVPSERLFVPADGKKGSGKRVWKIFGTLPTWKTTATIYLLDPLLCGKPQKVEEYLAHAGKFIGMGRFRARNGGFYGRFRLDDFSWCEVL